MGPELALITFVIITVDYWPNNSNKEPDNMLQNAYAKLLVAVHLIHYIPDYYSLSFTHVG